MFLFGDSEHGIIQTWRNMYLTTVADMCSVFGPMGFRKNSEISAGHPHVFEDCIQQSDASENNVPSLVLFYIGGIISFLVILVFPVNRGIPNRKLAIHSGFRKVLRKYQKPWSGQRRCFKTHALC
eukprot:SAG22_NODE_352_length_11827_cov_3.941252_1_plen_124_part_10